MEQVAPRSSVDRQPDGAALLTALDGVRSRLREHLPAERWFRSKGRRITAVRLRDGAALPAASEPEVAAALAVLDVEYDRGGGETYLLPLAARPAGAAQQFVPAEARWLARLGAPDGDWLLYDGLHDPAVCLALLRAVERAGDLSARAGRFTFDRTPVLSQATGGRHPVPVAELRRLSAEQSNTSILYDDRLVLKIFRRLDTGESPDLEIGRFLTLRARFPHVPWLAGFGRYEEGQDTRTVGVLTNFVPSAGDGWEWTLARLREFYAGAVPGEPFRPDAAYLDAARRLGAVTGELHVALASDPDDPAFAPEAVTPADLDALASAVEAQVGSALAELRRAADSGAARVPGIEPVLGLTGDARLRIRGTVARLAGVPLWKIRGHGDYHLGQVLRTAGVADDFVILDFEGEPARPLAERRAKQPPLRDVAGMLRSFTYASYAGLFDAVGSDADAARELESWRAGWEQAAAAAFIEGYVGATVARGVRLVPHDAEARQLLLSLFALERAAYELAYELNNRPTWLPIPLAAFRRELAA